MNDRCEELMARLADRGPEDLQGDEAALDHLADCERCYGFLEALGQVDIELSELPALEPPEHMVQAALSVVRSEPPPALPPARRRWLPGLSAAASLALMITVVTLTTTKGDSDQAQPLVQTTPQHATIVIDGKVSPTSPTGRTAVAGKRGKKDKGGEGSGGGDELSKNIGGQDGQLARRQMPVNAPSPAQPSSTTERERTIKLDLLKEGYTKSKLVLEKPEPAKPATKSPPKTTRMPALDYSKLPVEKAQRSPEAKEVFELEEEIDLPGLPNLPKLTEPPSPPKRPKRPKRIPRSARFKDERNNRLDEDDDGLDLGFIDQAQDESRRSHRTSGPSGTSGAARDFLASRDVVKGLRFQEAAGYWRNTYVPGDPSLRRLLAHLQQAQLPKALADLPQAALPYSQPLDPPESSALAMSLMADQRAAEGPKRTLVQLALKATNIHGRRRPTMNLALVLHIPEGLDLETRKTITTLVKRIARQKQLGDAFSITVAGRPGGTVVKVKDFDYGRVAVILNQLMNDELQAEGRALSVLEATQRAYSLVSPDDKAPLGASSLILITPRTLGSSSALLARAAHKQALQGNLTSVIGVSDRVVLSQLSQIALAGQGQHRWVTTPQEAETAVDRTLSAVSRVVARAVRLRIRLSKGVKLIDVLGSKRLDVLQAERVRQMEKSIDQRLSKTMGIQSDRGKDEDGIQIVIPSFYAGDTHVILLDVLAPGPGSVAEVNLKYKDLAFLKNGKAQAHLSLQKGDMKRGPLQLAVLKNLVAHEIARSLYRTSVAVRQGGSQPVQALVQSEALLQGLMRSVPG